MKKNVLFLAVTMAIFVFASAFVSKNGPDATTASMDTPSDIMTMNGLGLNLDNSGELMIKDFTLLKNELETMLHEQGYAYTIANIVTDQEAVTNGDFISKTFILQYQDESDEHALKVSYQPNSGNNLAAVTPICLGFRCTRGCNGRISPAGVFSCSACVGPAWSSCLQGAVPW